MKIIGTNLEDIAVAGQALRTGCLVAIPTETVYGLAGNARDVHTLARIFAVKKRPIFDPLIIHIGDPFDVDVVADSNVPFAKEIVEAFWPGPITLILPRRSWVPDLATSGLDTVAVRCPSHDIARAIIRKAGVPVAAPSANPFGYLSPTRANHVARQLGDKIDFIVDGGSCLLGVESTILDLSIEQPVILRPGGLSVERIRSVIPDIRVLDRRTSNPKAPGQLPSHYAPSRPLYLLPTGSLAQKPPYPEDKSHAAITFGSVTTQALLRTNWYKTVVDLSPDANTTEAAAALFNTLHSLDTDEYNAIWTERLPEEGLGLAVNDRLYKASIKLV